MLGVFDSGFGGLNVLSSLRKAVPDVDIVYLGDTARAPYGSRDRELITAFTKACCTELFNRGCSLVLLACHTASAETLRELQQEWLPEYRKQVGRDVNVMGVVRPIAEAASALCPSGGCIGIAATRATVESNAYTEEIAKQNELMRVVQQACPLLVPLVEEGWTKKPETRKILRTYLRSLKSANPDVMILGCTHYESLHGMFVQMMGRRTQVLHSPDVIAEKFLEYCERHPEYDLGTGGSTRFLTTGDDKRFSEIGSQFFGQDIRDVERIGIPV